MKKLLRSQRGETLVEVMCAAMLILIGLATLLSMVRFTSAAQHRSMEMEQALENMRNSLMEETPERTGEAVEYSFYADGEQTPSFTITADRGTKTGTYFDQDGQEKTVVFDVLLPPETEN